MVTDGSILVIILASLKANKHFSVKIIFSICFQLNIIPLHHHPFCLVVIALP